VTHRLDPAARVLVAGEQTLLGAALCRTLRADGFDQVRGCGGIDLTRPERVRALLQADPPDVVFVVGGFSAGIHANLRQPADLMQVNLAVALNLITGAHRAGVERLVYVGSSCCYPRDCAQPMQEASLFTSAVEPSSAAYAMAKLAGIKLVQAHRAQFGARYVSVIPGDLFGPGDDFHPDRSHVVAALLRRMVEARRANASEVVVWGTGRPRRDFVPVDDVARALAFVAANYDEDLPINIGSGTGWTIRELAHAIATVVGYEGALRFDADKPDGMPVKILDSTRLRDLGYELRTPLPEALHSTLTWYEQHVARQPNEDR